MRASQLINFVHLPFSSFFLHEYDIVLRRLQPALDTCGSIPRPCLKAAQSDQSLHNAESEIKAAILGIKDVAEALDRVHGKDDTIIPHRVFEIYPASDSRYWEVCKIRTVSQWAFDQLATEMESRDEHAITRLYKQIQGTTDAAAFRGRLWERQVHKFFRSIRTPRQFQIRSLIDRSRSLTIEFSPNTLHETFARTQYLAGLLTSAIEKGSSSYLKPNPKNFATFDAFLYQHGFDSSYGEFQPLLGVQITDGTDHSIALTGLKTAQTACKRNIPHLNGLRPSASKKWIVLFVVPAFLGASFKLQRIEPPSGAWESKTVQYILELPEHEVFNNLN